MESIAENFTFSGSASNIRKKILTVPDEKSYYPNEETIRAMEEVEKGIGLSREFETVEELMKDLTDSVYSEGFFKCR